MTTTHSFESSLFYTCITVERWMWQHYLSGPRLSAECHSSGVDAWIWIVNNVKWVHHAHSKHSVPQRSNSSSHHRQVASSFTWHLLPCWMRWHSHYASVWNMSHSYRLIYENMCRHIPTKLPGILPGKHSYFNCNCSYYTRFWQTKRSDILNVWQHEVFLFCSIATFKKDLIFFVLLCFFLCGF